MPILPPEAIPIAAYHQSAPAWLSKTSLNDYRAYGPAWWKLTYIDKTNPRPKPGGVEAGNALDCVLTEDGAAFEQRFAVKPDGHDGRTTAGKAWAAANAGKEHLSANDMLILADAVNAVRNHPRWADILRCKAQQTIRRSSPALGLGLQSRPDWFDADRGVLFDLKKTRDLDIFPKQAIDIGYHIQAAIAGWCAAGEGIALNNAYLVACEWERGARCRVWEIPHEVLAFADKQMREVAAEIAARVKSGDWADHPDAEIKPLPIPEYMMRKMEAA